MNVVHGLDALHPPLDRSVLTIGNFDGVHRAHQELLARARSVADDTGDPAVVLTFEPHPHTIVAPDHIPPRLTTLDQKLRHFQRAGADHVVVARSEPALFSLEAGEFIERVVHRLFHPTHVVEGASFGFGRGRKGNTLLLQELSVRFGYRLHVLDSIRVVAEGESLVVSSSLIRRLLLEGRVEVAARCLGRPYSLIGVVEKGDGRGRSLGFPTANLGQVDQLIPADGVYAGSASFEATAFPAAISIGPHPTFGGDHRCVEAHLLDIHRDLYGKTLELSVERFLRPQRKFAGPSELSDQLGRDVGAVRASTGGPGPPS